MYLTKGRPCLILLLLSAFCSATAISPHVVNVHRAKATSKHNYRYSHSLPDEYGFVPEDGWQTINVTDMQYKYPTGRALDAFETRSPDHASSRRSLNKLRQHSVHSARHTSSELSLGGAVSHLINDVWDALKGLGKSEGVTITWFGLQARPKACRFSFIRCSQVHRP